MTLGPEPSMVMEHLRRLTYADLNDDCLFEVAWGRPGPTRAQCYSLSDLDRAAEDALNANRAGNNVYVGVTLKCPSTPRFGRTRNQHAAVANFIVLDLDKDFANGAERLGRVARPAFLVATGTQPETRGQFWVPVRETIDLSYWDTIVRRLAQNCGADTSATGLNRLMRLAGTVSYPSSAKVARGYGPEVTRFYELDAWMHDLSDLSLRLPSPLRPTSRPRPLADVGRLLPLNPINVQIVLSLLRALPLSFAEEYELWRNVGFALHDSDPGPVGLALWKVFSARCVSKAALTDFDAYWARFGRGNCAAKVTLGSIIHYAKRAGWSPRMPWDVITRIKP